MSVCLSSKNGVRARKNHECVWCRERIEKGSLYDCRVGVEDGEIWSMRMHPECHAKEEATPWGKRDGWYEDFCDFEPVFDRPKTEEAKK